MINFLKETMEDLDHCKKDFYVESMMGLRGGRLNRFLNCPTSLQN